MGEQRGWKLHFPFLGEDPNKEKKSEQEILGQIKNRKEEGMILEQERELQETVNKYNKIYQENFTCGDSKEDFKISIKRENDKESGRFVFTLVLDNPPEELFNEEIEGLSETTIDKDILDKKRKLSLISPLLINFEKTDNPLQIKREIEKALDKFEKEEKNRENK